MDYPHHIRYLMRAAWKIRHDHGAWNFECEQMPKRESQRFSRFQSERADTCWRVCVTEPSTRLLDIERRSFEFIPLRRRRDAASAPALRAIVPFRRELTSIGGGPPPDPQRAASRV